MGDVPKPAPSPPPDTLSQGWTGALCVGAGVGCASAPAPSPSSVPRRRPRRRPRAPQAQRNPGCRHRAAMAAVVVRGTWCASSSAARRPSASTCRANFCFEAGRSEALPLAAVLDKVAEPASRRCGVTWLAAPGDASSASRVDAQQRRQRAQALLARGPPRISWRSRVSRRLRSRSCASAPTRLERRHPCGRAGRGLRPAAGCEVVGCRRRDSSSSTDALKVASASGCRRPGWRTAAAPVDRPARRSGPVPEQLLAGHLGHRIGVDAQVAVAAVDEHDEDAGGHAGGSPAALGGPHQAAQQPRTQRVAGRREQPRRQARAGAARVRDVSPRDGRFGLQRRLRDLICWSGMSLPCVASNLSRRPGGHCFWNATNRKLSDASIGPGRYIVCTSYPLA